MSPEVTISFLSQSLASFLATLILESHEQSSLEVTEFSSSLQLLDQVLIVHWDHPIQATALYLLLALIVAFVRKLDMEPGDALVLN